MNITRRGLLGMFAAGAAAAIVSPEILMPVRSITVPSAIQRTDDELWLYGVYQPGHWNCRSVMDPGHMHSIHPELGGAHSHGILDPGHSHDCPQYPRLMIGQIAVFRGDKLPPGWERISRVDGFRQVRDLAHPIPLSLYS